MTRYWHSASFENQVASGSSEWRTKCLRGTGGPWVVRTGWGLACLLLQSPVLHTAHWEAVSQSHILTVSQYHILTVSHSHSLTISHSHILTVPQSQCDVCVQFNLFVTSRIALTVTLKTSSSGQSECSRVNYSIPSYIIYVTCHMSQCHIDRHQTREGKESPWHVQPQQAAGPPRSIYIISRLFPSPSRKKSINLDNYSAGHSSSSNKNII